MIPAPHVTYGAHLVSAGRSGGGHADAEDQRGAIIPAAPVGSGEAARGSHVWQRKHTDTCWFPDWRIPVRRVRGAGNGAGLWHVSLVAFDAARLAAGKHNTLLAAVVVALDKSCAQDVLVAYDFCRAHGAHLSHHYPMFTAAQIR